MKKVIALLLTVYSVLLLCCGCVIGKKDYSAELKPDKSRLQSICNLATMECYFHNVAKSETQGLFNLDFTKKKFWIEYAGTVRIGIDFSEVQCDFHDNQIIITLPDAKVLDVGVDENSFTENSYYNEKGSPLKGKIKADEQAEAIRSAQEQMKENVQANKSLLDAAKNRARELIENYFVQLGALSETEYQIQWN